MKLMQVSRTKYGLYDKGGRLVLLTSDRRVAENYQKNPIPKKKTAPKGGSHMRSNEQNPL